MPDAEGNVTDQDWVQALGPSYENYTETPDLPQESSEASVASTEPAVEAPPVPVTSTEEVAPPIIPQQQPVSPVPDLTAQQRALDDQQAQISLQQQMNQMEQQYIQNGYDANISRFSAQQWATAQWAQYQAAKTTQIANEIAKQNLMEKLAQEHGIDRNLLVNYQDVPTMTTAAQQFGQISKLKQRVEPATQPAKAPVQSFAGGSATPVASTQAQALAYVRGEGGEMTGEQFIQAFGFDPR